MTFCERSWTGSENKHDECYGEKNVNMVQEYEDCRNRSCSACRVIACREGEEENMNMNALLGFS